MSSWKRYLPTIFAVILAGLGPIVPALQDLVAANPTVTLIIGSLATALAHLLRSPMEPKA